MAKHLFVFTFAILAVAAYSRTVPRTGPLKQADPATVGFSAERLLLADSLISAYMQHGGLPGGVFLLARHGKIVYYKNAGHREVDGVKGEFRKDDIFRIASMTKAITTVGIMQLYEQGKLRLDEPLYNYIPAFRETGVLDTFNPADSSFTTVPQKTPITIRHLLTHTSGIVYGYFESGIISAVHQKLGMVDVGLSHQYWTTEEFIDKLAKVPLYFQPGERFNYGLSMDVLGRVIEVVSHQRLSEYFRKNIFDPLGMDDTWFYLPEEKQNRLVPVYTHEGDKVVIKTEDGLVANINYPLQEDNGHYAGGGGLSSTALDYARFLQALLNNGEYNGHRILGRKTIELMTSDQLIALNREGKGISNVPGITFCLGFGLTTDEAGVSSKSGGTYEWGGYWSSKFYVDPKEDLIFVGLANAVPFDREEFFDQMTAIFYGAIVD